MHAPVWKRTNPTQIIGLALAIGLAASISLNVVMLSRSDDNQTAGISTQASVDLLAQQQRFYAAKEARQDAVEMAAGVKAAQSTLSQQAYAGLKADQLNGITAGTSVTLNPALQRHYDRKSDQMNGIVAQASTTLTASPQIYSDLKADELNGTTWQASTMLTLSPQLYVDLKSDQMNGIASTTGATSWQRYADLKADQLNGIAITDHAASWRSYVDLKSDQMDGIAAGQ